MTMERTVHELPAPELAAIERFAAELAGLAGAEIAAAFNGAAAVRYKSVAAGEPLWRDPVSAVDDRVEAMIRARIAARFPHHDIVGEESDDRPNRGHDLVWAIDPIDGTVNFINGFPIFAASIGILHRGHPLAGAIWVSVGHALRPGVYHAKHGDRLRFDGEHVVAPANATIRRRLTGVPRSGRESEFWDTRTVGSAAFECAMAAAGAIQVARFSTARIWDVAAGADLVEAAGGTVLHQTGGVWQPMRTFTPGRGPDGTLDLRYWTEPIAVGEHDAVKQLAKLHAEIRR
jgi:myo-inositol-1(or 4)-monophosphatase